MNTITELPVERDGYGYWTHPEYDKFFGDRDSVPVVEFDEWLSTMRMEYHIVELEYDEDSPAHERYFEQGEVDLHDWHPTRPEGDGWFIVSIHDTDDGPVCVWMLNKGGDQ